jgi:hypothetical protein
VKDEVLPLIEFVIDALYVVIYLEKINAVPDDDQTHALPVVIKDQAVSDAYQNTVVAYARALGQMICCRKKKAVGFKLDLIVHVELRTGQTQSGASRPCYFNVIELAQLVIYDIRIEFHDQVLLCQDYIIFSLSATDILYVPTCFF